jgi:hypothetical protein
MVCSTISSNIGSSLPRSLSANAINGEKWDHGSTSGLNRTRIAEDRGFDDDVCMQELEKGETGSS